jgi:hypothetical protein
LQTAENLLFTITACDMLCMLDTSACRIAI